MPFTTKKINMLIHNNSTVMLKSNYFSNNTNNSNITSRFTGRNVTNAFTNSMIGRIQHIKGSGCGSCGGVK